MKKIIYAGAFVALMAAGNAEAQIGQPWIHDPATLTFSDGKWWTFGTGGGGICTEDGWTWMVDKRIKTGAGAAPDVVKIGDRYLIGYSSTGGGLGGGHEGHVLTRWNLSLDPSSPVFNYSEPIEVASSKYDEDCDAIDIGFLLDPTSGRLFITYGTYFGNIRQVELNPKTGGRLEGAVDKDVAIDCEASVMMYEDGWYYLLGTHGTCCDGVNSTYNIVVGRSRNPEGPFIDNVGRDMLEGGGRMVIAAGNRKTGAGHFGRTIIDEGVQIMSCHFEADYDRSARSVLDVRPLLWRNNWPVAGEHFKEGVYSIESERRGYSLELEVDFVRQQVERANHWNMDPAEPYKSLEVQKLEDVIDTWPKGNTTVRCSDYMFRPHQKWQITAVPEAGGYLSDPYFKITIAGTNRALAATADLELETVPEYTGADNQLWRIEQLTDGTYRIMPKQIPGKEGINTKYCIYSQSDSNPTLAKYDFHSDNSKWNFRQH